MVYENPDVVVGNHGTIVTFQPLTEQAQEWVDNNVALEDWQWMSGSFAVDPRYADDLIAGMEEYGLTVAC